MQERVIPEEIVIQRTLEKVNREAALAAVGSKRHTRLMSEKTAVVGKLQKRRKLMPDR